jgi:NTP pyrophosphatase (non-canonical NTP hydrolase)
MIKNAQLDSIESLDAIVEIISSLNRRFPNGNEIFQRVSRLSEETGELAKAVNHRENMGIKNQKHGDPEDQELVKEALDVMGAAIDIVLHYNLLGEFQIALQERYQHHEIKNFYKT